MFDKRLFLSQQNLLNEEANSKQHHLIVSLNVVVSIGTAKVTCMVVSGEMFKAFWEGETETT